MTETPQRRRPADPGSDREKRHEDKDMYTLHVGLRIRRLRQAQQMGVRTLANEIG
ncbi:MAG: hypothetical protein IT190_07445, partial [Microbacteriaceae bacterium]|nr:hypothetical protein [Microbacteriaceae bacterium]